MNFYKLFCLHLAGAIYENLTLQGHTQKRMIGVVKRMRAIPPPHPLLADEAKRLCDEAERSI